MQTVTIPAEVWTQVTQDLAFIKQQLSKRPAKWVRKDDTWQDEETAAFTMGVSKRYLRRKVKSQEWLITFRNTNGRGWEYNKSQIDYLKKTLTKS